MGSWLVRRNWRYFVQLDAAGATALSGRGLSVTLALTIMFIFYSEKSDPMLLDSVGGLSELSRRVAAFASADADVAEFSAQAGDPAPYEHLLKGLRVQKAAGQRACLWQPMAGLCYVPRQLRFLSSPVGFRSRKMETITIGIALPFR